MARQFFIPGYGQVIEDGEEEYFVPGYGQMVENQPAGGRNNAKYAKLMVVYPGKLMN